MEQKTKANRGVKTHSHKAHGKLGNPSPIQTEEYRSKLPKQIGTFPGTLPLGRKSFAFKLPVDCEAFLSQWDERDKAGRMTWTRSLLVTAIREKMEEEGFIYESR